MYHLQNAGAKVLLFFDMTKFFCNFLQFNEKNRPVNEKNRPFGRFFNSLGSLFPRLGVLSHLCAVMDGGGDGGDHQFAICIHGREDHTLGFDTHHLTRREVRNKEHLFADEYGRIGV